MGDAKENWKAQIRKGYLELCILLLVKKQKRLYGFDLIEQMGRSNLEVKEGTIYPLLNRMSSDGLLQSTWDTENVKGHPRKFYSITKSGLAQLEDMADEFGHMVSIFEKIKKLETGSSL